MDLILENVRDFTEPFIDDMAVCSATWKGHLDHTYQFLQTIRKASLTLSLQKCSFGQSSVTFRGHEVGSGLKRIDPSKVACIDSIKPPATKSDVRKIIGFFSYFVPSCLKT